MSESTGTPATPVAPAPAPAPAPAAPQTTSAPAPAAQPGISVSEAARLLSRQRRQGAEPPTGPVPVVTKPSANDMAKQAQAEAQPAPAAKPPPSLPAGTSALERALGVTAPAPAESPADDGALVEIEGQRLKSLAEVQEFARRKSADYTQKTQALAEQSRQLEAQQQALQAVLPYIQPELARLAQIVQNTPQRPDPALLESDPQGYLRQRAQYEQAMEEQQRLGNLTTLQQQAQARAMEQAVSQANEQLAREMPAWADPKERLALQQEIITWATEKGGFSRDELRGLTSPHHLKTMLKAAMYDRMVEGARTTAPVARTLAPVRGAPPPPAPTERIQVAERSFEEKPSIRTGAALLAARRRQ